MYKRQSVFNILRSQSMNLRHNLRPMLELESGSNDPMAYVLTIVLIEFITSAGIGADDILISFLIQFAVGGASGFLLGKLAVVIIDVYKRQSWGTQIRPGEADVEILHDCRGVHHFAGICFQRTFP